MTRAALREQWLHAIRVAGTAVQAAARVEILPGDEVSRRQRLLSHERRWL